MAGMSREDLGQLPEAFTPCPFIKTKKKDQSGIKRSIETSLPLAEEELQRVKQSAAASRPPAELLAALRAVDTAKLNNMASDVVLDGASALPAPQAAMMLALTRTQEAKRKELQHSEELQR